MCGDDVEESLVNWCVDKLVFEFLTTVKFEWCTGISSTSKACMIFSKRPERYGPFNFPFSFSPRLSPWHTQNRHRFTLMHQPDRKNPRGGRLFPPGELLDDRRPTNHPH